jgi:hypothetical protein
MAGKTHFQAYVSYTGGGQLINKCQPGSRLVRAYAEGRNASAAGALQTTNPHPIGQPARTAWDSGWNDKNAAQPRSHCCV